MVGVVGLVSLGPHNDLPCQTLYRRWIHYTNVQIRLEELWDTSNKTNTCFLQLYPRLCNTRSDSMSAPRGNYHTEDIQCHSRNHGTCMLPLRSARVDTVYTFYKWNGPNPKWYCQDTQSANIRPYSNKIGTERILPPGEWKGRLLDCLDCMQNYLSHYCKTHGDMPDIVCTLHSNWGSPPQRDTLQSSKTSGKGMCCSDH